MKKILLFISALTLGFCLKAQTIEYTKTSLSGMIGHDGELQSTTGVPLGFVMADGTIQNAAHAAIGYVINDNIIENSSHTAVGYLTSDGTVQDASHTVVGYIKNDGTVQDANQNTFAHAGTAKKTWAAINYFFFKAN